MNGAIFSSNILPKKSSHSCLDTFPSRLVSNVAKNSSLRAQSMGSPEASIAALSSQGSTCPSPLRSSESYSRADFSSYSALMRASSASLSDIRLFFLLIIKSVFKYRTIQIKKCLGKCKTLRLRSANLSQYATPSARIIMSEPQKVLSLYKGQSITHL